MGVDQLVLGLTLPSATLGLYVVASSLCNLPRFLAQSFGLVAYPHVASLASERQGRAIVRLVIIACVVGALVIGALELVAGAIIPLFFGRAYAGAVPVAQILLLSALLFGIGRVLSDSLQGAGRPLGGTVSEAVAVLTLAVALVVLGDSLDVFRFAVVMTLAAGAGLVTLAVIGYFRMQRPRDAAYVGITPATAEHRRGREDS
jgi:O-antigen/teichoic acid export membrane protein